MLNISEELKNINKTDLKKYIIHDNELEIYGVKKIIIIMNV